MSVRISLLLAAMMVLPATETWNRFLGAGGMPVAPEADPPTTWNANEHIAWTTDLPGSAVPPAGPASMGKQYPTWTRHGQTLPR